MERVNEGDEPREDHVRVDLSVDDLIFYRYALKRLSFRVDHGGSEEQMFERTRAGEETQRLAVIHSVLANNLSARSEELSPLLPFHLQHDLSIGMLRAEELAFPEPETEAAEIAQDNGHAPVDLPLRSQSVE